MLAKGPLVNVGDISPRSTVILAASSVHYAFIFDPATGYLALLAFASSGHKRPAPPNREAFPR